MQGVQKCLKLVVHETVFQKHLEKTKHDRNKPERKEIGKAQRRYGGQEERRRLGKEGMKYVYIVISLKLIVV